MSNKNRAPLTLVATGLTSFWKSVQRTDMPISQVLLFLHVAVHSPMSTAELVSATGVSQSSVSRNIAKLGKGVLKDGTREPGLGLVENYPDPVDNRRDLVKLTPEGEKVAARLAEHVSRLAKKIAFD
jgi:DNA-binding MarR family transcriptional regulator